MGLTVYGSGISPPSRSVYVFCKVTGIPYTDKTIQMTEWEHKGEAYLKINPVGKVPCIVDDDFILTECFSILKYLADKHKVADHWYPAELKARAKVNEYLDWHHTTLRKAVSAVKHEQVWNKLKFGKPTDEAKLVKDYEFLDEVLGHLEKIFLGDDAFLFGGEISIADICVMSEISNIVPIQRRDILASHPKLAAWKDRVTKRLNPAYDEVYRDFRKLESAIPMSKLFDENAPVENL
ncbi:glutathione S-transferase theta-1-like [Asterias rubens]|uniref:glutathione S-transferase theta-1-like n=1 Tax=Asterias rubens TaxID=7604 RepID=UPI001455C38D|nr:glutathione S-transferase theta-1-like [Asterias rubens]XP_033628079.1 glutathione S-transferase theta-1-like [Asterias rubens]